MDKVDIGKSATRHRRKLNSEQVEVLELLYKFRFGSNNLFAEYFGKQDRSFVFKRLKILLEQGYIGKRFDSSYRIQGKPAAYYLLPAGARKLGEYRDEEDAAEINIKGIYTDATVSEQFAMHCMTVFDLYNRLTAQYEDELEFLSKSDQTGLENLPKQKPDAHLMLETENGTQYYFMDILDDDTHLLIEASKKIKRYIDYKRSGNWALVTKSLFPKIIFICNSKEASGKVQKRCEAALHRAWVLDLKVKAATGDHITLD